MGDERRRRILATIARWDQARNAAPLAPHERRALAAAIDAALTRPSADARLVAKELGTLRAAAESPW